MITSGVLAGCQVLWQWLPVMCWQAARYSGHDYQWCVGRLPGTLAMITSGVLAGCQVLWTWLPVMCWQTARYSGHDYQWCVGRLPGTLDMITSNVLAGCQVLWTWLPVMCWQTARYSLSGLILLGGHCAFLDNQESTRIQIMITEETWIEMIRWCFQIWSCHTITYTFHITIYYRIPFPPWKGERGSQVGKWSSCCWHLKKSGISAKQLWRTLGMHVWLMKSSRPIWPGNGQGKLMKVMNSNWEIFCGGTGIEWIGKKMSKQKAQV